jgi:hypothetical protein
MPELDAVIGASTGYQLPVPVSVCIGIGIGIGLTVRRIQNRNLDHIVRASA